MGVNIEDFVKHGNYVEIILKTSDNSINVDQQLFGRLLQNIRTKGHPLFQKHCKQYINRNIYMETYDNNQIKVYKQKYVMAGDVSDSLKVVVYSNEKQPYHMFPTSKQMHSIAYVSKAICKINNRVFVNFERKQFNDAEVYFKIYINYNHDHNVDLANIQTALNVAISLIKT